MTDYLILGCGYTATRVAYRLIDDGHRVTVTNREPKSIQGARNLVLDVADPQSLIELQQHLVPGMVVLNSISSTDRIVELVAALSPFQPARIVYISTTGVYGSADFVDEQTLPEPGNEKESARLQAERFLASGDWSTLILRPAAIYGPGRGVHTSARTGVFRPPPGGNRIISRIHVEDLASHLYAGLQSSLAGAFPVADEEPCPSLTVAEFAFAAVGRPFATSEREATARDERKTGRSVDGSAIRMKLGLQLRYPSYREGVLACLREEGSIPK